MQSNNFRDKEILNMPPDLERITRPEKDKKTRSFDFLSERQKQILKEGYSPEKDTGFGLDFYE